MIQDQSTGFHNVQFINVINESSQVSICQVKNTQTNKLYIAKIFKKKTLTKEEENDFIHQVIEYSQLNNPAVLQLIKFSLFSYDPKFFPAILTEYMINESLSIFFEREKCGIAPKELTNAKKYIILLGIILGMKYLHSQGLIHRNLNPSNILLDENFYPRISNFFFQKKLNLPKKSNEINFESIFYLAPEILANQQETYQSDVYSFGMIFYRLLTKKSPFEGYNDISHFLRDIRINKRPDLTNINDESIQIFLNKCWSTEPSERPRFDEIFTEISKDKYKKLFEADENEVQRYLNLFNDINNNNDAKQNKANKYIEKMKILTKKLLNENPSKALIYFKQLADKGDINAMCQYATMMHNGLGCKVNKTEAAKYYKMSADRGNVDSIRNYAIMLYYGDGIKIDKIESSRYHKMLAEKGDIKAMFDYALMLSNGDGIPVNKKEAAFYYKKSADLGNENSMLNYAQMLVHGDGIPMNKKEAIRYLKMCADKGNEVAMLNIGIMLNNGNGVDINKKEAARYYKMSADKGNPTAMLNYAVMNMNGEGIKVNKKEAAKYMKMSADSGDSDAMLHYGSMLYDGDGVPANKREAAKYFKMSADSGNSTAMHNYAVMLGHGEGVPMDIEEGYQYRLMSMFTQYNNYF